jgi:hypothetical protein
MSHLPGTSSGWLRESHQKVASLCAGVHRKMSYGYAEGVWKFSYPNVAGPSPLGSRPSKWI